MVRMTINIDDRNWPKLGIVIDRRDLAGQPQVMQQQVQFDDALVTFEPHVKNALKAMVDELVKRRQGR